MGSIERIKKVAQLIAESSKNHSVVVVVSAMSGETNRLVGLAEQISPKPQLPAYDMLLASGEQVASALTAMALHDLGISAMPLLAFQAGITTDNLFSNAKIKSIDTTALTQMIAAKTVPVIAGFQGISDSDEHIVPHLTTLGRGGSDTSAVAFAIALKADRCDIFTDVDGVYTCDPRLVPKARRIEHITFDEMMELASLGAKVLHMRSVELAAKFQLPLRVLSTFQPENGGTLVSQFLPDHLESPVVSALSVESGESLLSMELEATLAASPSRFFKPLAQAGINVDVINKSAPNPAGKCTLSFTVPRLEAKRACEILAEFAPQQEQTALAKVSIVGIGMRTHSGVAALMFETLEQQSIPILLVTTSEIKVSVLIPEAKKQIAAQALHTVFGLDAHAL